MTERDPHGRPKLYINPSQVEMFREYAINVGTEEKFDKWLEDCVIIVEPI